jgi:parallel beta-helix repeat protein
MPLTVSGEGYREFSEPRWFSCATLAQVQQIRNPVDKAIAKVGSGLISLEYEYDADSVESASGIDVLAPNNTQLTGKWIRLQREANTTLSVTWFGAVGDGVTDDTAEIQAALDTVGLVTNGTLYIPDGTFLVSSALTVRANTVIDGVGTIKATGSTINYIFYILTSNVRIENIEIDGDDKAMIGIYAYGGEHLTFRGLTIHNCTKARGVSGLYAAGILFREIDYGIIDACYFYANGRSDEISGSIYFYDSATDSKYCVISNNYIENAGFHGINVYDTSYCKVINNYVNQGNIGTNAYNNGYGILCYDGQHDTLHNMCIGNVISGNTVENCYGIGIYLVVTKDCVVSNNVLKNVCLQQDSPTLHNAGININEGIRTIVTGNTIDGVGGAQTNIISGIGILAGTEVVVSDNHINDVTTGSVYSYGIYIGGQGEVFTDSGRGVIVKGNTIRTCDSDGIRAEGNLKTECVITGNTIEEVKRHGISVQWFQRGIISNNTILNFGGGLSGIVMTNIGGNSQRNLIQGNMVNAVTAPVSNYGSSRCYYLDTPGPNWVLNNTAYASPTLGIGYYDPNVTGGNIYEGNQVTGTITTPYNLTAPGVCSFSGAGTPEGAVAAAIGSIYRRTNGGASTSLYVKESGTGNTGWVAK